MTVKSVLATGAVIVGAIVAFNQRERLRSWGSWLLTLGKATPSAAPAAAAAPPDHSEMPRRAQAGKGGRA